MSSQPPSAAPSSVTPVTEPVAPVPEPVPDNGPTESRDERGAAEAEAESARPPEDAPPLERAGDWLFGQFKQRYAALLAFYLVACDSFAIAIAFLLALILYELSIDPISEMFGWLTPSGVLLQLRGLKALIWGIVTIPPLVYLPVFYMFGLYKRELSLLNVGEIRKIVRATIVGWGFMLILLYLLRFVVFSRLLLAYSPFCVLLVVTIERTIFYKIHAHYHRLGLGISRCLIYGAGQTGRSLLRKLYHSPKLGFQPVGFVDDDPDLDGAVVELRGARDLSVPVLGALKDLPRIVARERIHQLFIAVPSLPPEKSLDLVRLCRTLKIRFGVVPNLYNLVFTQVRVTDVDGIPIITMKEPQYRPVNNFLKRVVDVVMSTGFLVLLSPLFAVLAALVKLDSPGPALFSHKRIGKDGKPFTMYKFRTMFVGTPAQWVNPLSSEDPRVTRVGRYLRRFSVDELPQFWNVLRGDMSVVGPRPEMPFIVEGYRDLERQRLNVKPGVTGLWQISEDRAGEIHANMDYDLYYIEKQSLLLDLIIILATAYSAVRGKGAY